MAEKPSLEEGVNFLYQKTVIKFKDGEHEFSRGYDSLFWFQEGEVISLVGGTNSQLGSDSLPVRNGEYRVTDVSNHLGADPEGKEPDEFYRYYECERVPVPDE